MLFTLCRCGFLNILLPQRVAITTTTHTITNVILTVTTLSRNRKKRTKRKQLKSAVKIVILAEATVNKILVQIQILLFLIATVVLCTPTDRKNDINLTPPKQLTTLLTTTKLTLTLTLPLHLQFLAAFVQLLLLQVQLLLVTTNFQSELHHMLCDLTIQRHTVAITYDLSETPAKKAHLQFHKNGVKASNCA